MTEEERIDEIIRLAARDYNRAPEVPRDEMWNAIQAARESAGAGPRLHVAAGGAPRIGSATRQSGSRRIAPHFVWMGAAAAALLLVATGVGIGRWTSSSAPAIARRAAVRAIAEAPAPVPTAPNDEIGSSPAVREVEKTPTRSGGQPTTPRSRDEIRKDPRVLGTGTVRPLSPSRYAVNPTDVQTGSNALSPVSTTYQMATQRHLADAEALLVSFSVGTRDARMDAQFGAWARGLLSNTRLLLDSPAGDDPRRAKLLQDLELVLAQIVQLSPNAAAQDRELIEGSIQQGHVMTRLRSAIPADQPRGILER
ncbi:MAG: hypothetical protein ABI681_02935 [Gemmatimonadales bacterium]